MKIWWCLNVVWLLLFGYGAYWFLTQKNDWTGTPQTLESRILSIIALVVVFLVILLIQLIIGFFIAKHKNKKRQQTNQV
ncbi:DUF3923 family protein [Enterococcus sp. AZ103]|uniref:DUF3923 family protein n=1 Tax=Enterococcus sp. AZ103 TaxID=2774628 RepID=UPI003F25EEBF